MLIITMLYYKNQIDNIRPPIAIGLYY